MVFFKRTGVIILDRFKSIYNPGLAYKDWIPHISVGAENYRMGLSPKIWISHLSVADENSEDWCLPHIMYYELYQCNIL